MSNIETGGCLCGQIKYKFDRDTVIASHHCHCKDCQRSTGSGKASLLMVPTAAMETSGELKTYTVLGTAGSHVNRGFCGNCGSPVMSTLDEMPDLNIVKLGSLDDSSWVNIESSFWCDSAETWSPADNDLPMHAANPKTM